MSFKCLFTFCERVDTPKWTISSLIEAVSGKEGRILRGLLESLTSLEISFPQSKGLLWNEKRNHDYLSFSLNNCVRK